ncbi:nitrilase-related carbon-nitrogen hydrolase [Mesorhizobium sp.]|uniref:nitrilase-related carbon-nitrogen hydrolase n=1 Tax=Mesorhizobium sp. TaxID=1871066 RepID=UPI000FE78B5B|nr:nitrilase-related carbon-nitrogen hydrolase [Mesorhizobium sp.]RWD96776.1 MAG: hypothetical protein EOS40_31350 [Mesorhizobium sp.]
MNAIKLASAQIACHAGDIDKNVEKHLEFINRARSEGIDVLVFPELSLTDYLSSPDTSSLSRTISDPAIDAIVNATVGMAVSFGFIEAAENGRCYISQALANDGMILNMHRKINLPSYGKLVENRYYTAGDSLGLVDLKSTQVATLICADSRNPAITWLSALNGAELLLHPIASAKSAVGPNFDIPANWEINLRYMAMNYGLPIVMTNHCGHRGSLDFWGGSRIINAFGAELARAGESEELIFAEIDPNDSRKARHLLPTVRYSDPQFIATELDRFLQHHHYR